MLSKNERIIVEALKSARSLEIRIPPQVIGGVLSEELSLMFRVDTKLLAHDIAIAVQSHFNRYHK